MSSSRGLPQGAVLPVPPAGGEGGCLVEEGLLPVVRSSRQSWFSAPVDVVQPLGVEPPRQGPLMSSRGGPGRAPALPSLAGDVADEALGAPGLLGGGDAAAGVDVVYPVLDHADLAPTSSRGWRTGSVVKNHTAAITATTAATR